MIMKQNHNKILKAFDITTKIILFVYITFSLFFLYEEFLFQSCYDKRLKTISDFLGLYVECGEGIAVAVAMFYSALIKMILLCLLPVMIGLRVAVYFCKKRKMKNNEVTQ